MKLLIVSPDAYSIFHPETKYIFGGIEIETGHHAKGLTELGVEVVVATRDHGVPQHLVNKVAVIPIPKLYGKGYWEKRQTLGGRIRYRLMGDSNPHTDIQGMMRAVQPDAGYIMGMSPEAVALSRYCRDAGRIFIFRAAHDKDLADNDEHMRQWAKVSAKEAREVIESATVLLAQTPFQQNEFKRTYGRESVLMFPPIDLEQIQASEKKWDVLWIGRNNSFKRPEQLAQIATALREYKFCMIFNKVDAADWEKTVNSLTPNVEVIESAPVTEIEKYFASSRIFLSTSLHEGFPNTFLQAAKYGLPVVSMGSDPNSMLSSYHAGILAGDNTERAIAEVRNLLVDAVCYKECSQSSRNYVQKFNDRKQISRQLLELIHEALRKKGT